MIICDFFVWWYTYGWKEFTQRVFSALRSVADFFSIGSLFRTLFDPFKQISVQEAGQGLDVAFRNFLDRVFSRTFGAIIRTGLIIIGIAVLIIDFIFSVAAIILWPFILLAPIACIILCILGVTL